MKDDEWQGRRADQVGSAVQLGGLCLLVMIVVVALIVLAPGATAIFN